MLRGNELHELHSFMRPALWTPAAAGESASRAGNRGERRRSRTAAEVVWRLYGNPHGCTEHRD